MCGKGCARIDNLDTVIEGLGKGRQWNGDMAGAYNNQCWWRRKALDKNIISFRTGAALDSIGMSICFTMPDSMVSVFNDPGIKSCITQCSIGSLTRKDEDFGANMLNSTNHGGHRQAFFLV